jgi:ribokinase
MDTTGAGDAFAGALAFMLSKERDKKKEGEIVDQRMDKYLLEAVEYANYVGALSTTKLGAQNSYPCKKEVEEFISQIIESKK